MAATTNPSTEPAHFAVPRFDGVERAVHWTTALLFFTCLATAAALYLNPIAAFVGRRELVKEVHVIAGLLLPWPLLVGGAGTWGRALRAEVGRLNRWNEADWLWLRSWHGRRRLPTGKFNAGQKLNAAFVVGAVLLLLATGSIMRWFSPFPLLWRTGATFVHDWTALGFAIVVAGHIWMAATRRPRA